VTRAYRVPVFGGEADPGEGLRSRVARGRPNWWVILAVSLGLMALLVATAGGTPPAAHRGAATQASAPALLGSGAQHGGDTRRGSSSSVTTTTTTSVPTTTTTAPSTSNHVASSLVTTPAPGTVSVPQAAAVTTTTLPPATTTTTDGAPLVPADRTQTQGYMNPPLQTSGRYGFTGTGAMAVSVVWSGDTYLTMEVTCPSGNQSVGGTSAMAASLPDAGGSCLATVSEPASESASLTYTITISPAGG
jgi:hypothetical protein